MGILEGKIGKILDNAFVGIILCDGQYNCVEASDVAVKILGIKEENIIGKNIEEVFRLAGLGVILDNIKKTSDSGNVQSRLCALKLTPTPHLVKIRLFPFSDENLKQDFFCVILCEIWQEEARFEESINREFIFKKLFYNSPFPMWIYDPATLQFLVVNDSSVKTLGYTNAEFLSMRISDVLCYENFGVSDDVLNRGEYAENTAKVIKCRKKDGTFIYLEVTESPIVFGNKNATVALGRDVTEDLKARERLNYINELLTLVWEHSPEGLRLTDENGIIIKVNDAFCRMFGKRKDELEGKKFTCIYHPTIADRIEKSFFERFKNRQFPDKFEDKFKLWDGREIWLEVYSSFFETKGEVPMLLSIFRDITESKRIFEDLKQSERRFKTLAEHVSDVVCVTDAEMTIVDISPSVSRFLRFKEEEVIGKQITSFLTANSLVELNNNLAQKKFNQQYQSNSITGELEFVRKDDEIVWADVCIDALFDADKNHIGFVWAIRDATEKLRAQAILRLQAAALESAANGIIITTIDGTIVWANSAFYQLTGYDSEEVIGKSPRILNSGRQNKEFYENLWQTILSGRNWHGELINKRKDGSLYIEEMSITPVFGRGLEITHFVAIKSDITKRKEMERELYHSKKRFELIFNSNPAGMAIVSLRDFRFIEVNNNFLEITKLSREQVVGTVADELLIFEKQQDWEELKRKLITTDSIGNFEIAIRSRDNKVRTVLVSTETITLGLEECAIIIFNDITERKALEEQLRHSNKLETLGALAGGVAHDFNNMLTVIEGHVSMVLMNSNLPPAVQNSLKEVHDAAERAANLTKQILTFGRKQKFEPAPVNVNEVVTNLVKILRRIVGENIKIETALQPNIPSVLGDVGMIEQVLINLIVNARDAMPKGGTVTISTYSRYIPVYKLPLQKGLRDGDYVIFSVKDTGIGIKPENIQKIFEPFFTTKPAGKGTGLGLAIVQDIVQQHRGWIDVKSEVGVGTEFFVYLPSLEHVSQTYQQSQAVQKVIGGGETIVLVEDDEKVNDLARAALEQYGYKVLTARDAGEALNHWAKHKDQISLIIIDMVLPFGFSGIRLAEQITAEKPNLKVVIMCGYLPNDIQSQILKLRGWQFIQKPFLPSYLAKMVRQVLDTNTKLINQ